MKKEEISTVSVKQYEPHILGSCGRSTITTFIMKEQ